MLNRTYDVTLKINTFQGKECWVAYDNSGGWRAWGATHGAPTDWRELPAYLFHADEIVSSWYDDAGIHVTVKA